MTETPPPIPPIEPGETFSRFGKWCAAKPAAAALLAACTGAVVYFLGFLPAFRNGTRSAMHWASEAWNSENNQEHCWFIIPVAFFIVWSHRGDLQRARKEPSNAGLAWVAAGVISFIVSSWTLEPRIAIFSLALLIYGGVQYLWGREAARIFFFPCLFLLFMVPVGGLTQRTNDLQLLVASTVKTLSSLIGVKVVAVGTDLHAVDGTFNFNIAGGCSGIRSLMAMVTLSALYVHFTQRVVWKQLVIFGSSIVFAVIGNIGRVFSVVLVAKFIDNDFAGGPYHDWSGFIFFPIAVGAMVGFTKLLNADWRKFAADAMKPEVPRNATKTREPISYDY